MSNVVESAIIDATKVFGRDPLQYDHARISYDPGFVLKILGDAVGNPDHVHDGVANNLLSIMDIGAGSGKLGDVFVKSGYPTTFVEPNANFLDYLSQKYADNPDVRIIGARAENINVPDHSVDVVVMGDAAHWVNEKSLPELRRILKPEGKMILFARFFSQESPVTHKLHKLLMRNIPDYSSSTSQLVRDYRNVRKRLGHHLTNEESSAWSGFITLKSYSQDEMVDLLKSLSFCANAIEKDEAAFRKDIIKPLWDFAQKEGLINKEGKLPLPYEINALYGVPRTRMLGEFDAPGRGRHR